MIDPNWWGPSLWTSIHYIALGYPETPTAKDAATYREFFAAIGNVLPCKCAVNYKRHFETDMPVDPFLGGRRDLFAWTIKMHNLVNAESGKPTWNADEAYDFYASGAAVKGKGGPGIAGTMALSTLIAACAIGVAYTVYRYTRT
jgi:hypothetical protein